MTVEKLKWLFKDYDDSEVIHFEIDETNLKILVDNYNYQPHLEQPFKDANGNLIVPVTATCPVRSL